MTTLEEFVLPPSGAPPLQASGLAGDESRHMPSVTGLQCAEVHRFEKPISGRLRAQVLERNGYTCQMCGIGAGDEMDDGRAARLHAGHIVDRDHGGNDELSNLRALCSTCNQGAKNLVQEPPGWTWLLGQLRRATQADQEAPLAWLNHKFGGRRTMTERREVRVKPHNYQPTKAELEGDMSIRRADGSRPTPEEVARIALGQVKVVEDPKA